MADDMTPGEQVWARDASGPRAICLAILKITGK